MNFKVGALVKINQTTYRCSGCGGNHGQYFHGTKIDTVALNSRGRVLRIESEKGLVLKLRDGNEVVMHPDELGLVSEKRTTDSLKGLPQHPLLEMIKESPSIVVDEQLYLIQGAHSANSNSIANLGKNAYGLSDPIPLSSLDDLFFQRAESELAGWREAYAKELLESISTPVVTIDSDIPQRIYQEVFPYFRNNKEEKVATVLGESIQTKVDEKAKLPQKYKSERDRISERKALEMKNEIEELRKELYSPEPQQPAAPRSKMRAYLDKVLADKAPTASYNPSTLIGKAIGRKAVLFNNGAAFEINSVKEIKNGTLVPFIVNGRGYNLGTELSMENLGRGLSNLLLEKQTNETFDVNLSLGNLQNTVRKQIEDLPEFAGLTEYEEGEVGFIKKTGIWYATLRVPAFAIKSPYNGSYYKFDSARIGIRFPNFDDEYPLLVDNNNHPFLHNERKSFARICLGGRNYLPSADNIGLTVAQRLLKVKEVIMHGYTGRSYASDYALSDDNNLFDENRTTLAKIQKEGVPIFGETA
jgi:hypothetical protein